MSNEEHDASWALKLLEPDTRWEQNFFEKNWSYICSTIFGISVPMGLNFWLKRPPISGIHRHFACGAIGFGVGHLVTEREKFVLARRDAIYRDYIRLHPEDFPPPERKKFSELFLRWQPVR